MELRRTKRPIMGVAALLVYLYHFFPIPRGLGIIEYCLRMMVLTSYVGVDVFFFLSGFSFRLPNTDHYLSYIKKRFLRLFPIFLLSCLIHVIGQKFSWDDFLFTILGVRLFQKGGASFLWFIPAIFLFYLFAPLYDRLAKRLGHRITFAASILFWFLCMFVLEHTFRTHPANIFLCRIPIFLLGYTLKKESSKSPNASKADNKQKLLLGSLATLMGIILLWLFGAENRSTILFQDSFYLAAIPFVVGAVMLFDVYFQAHHSGLFHFFGSITLELYCLQMALGPVLTNYVANHIPNALAVFLIVFVLLCLVSYLISKCFQLLFCPIICGQETKSHRTK